MLRGRASLRSESVVCGVMGKHTRIVAVEVVCFENGCRGLKGTPGWNLSGIEP
jgi:hypothetical protein